MPRFVLTEGQLVTLHRLSGLGPPAAGSPIELTLGGEPLAPDDPEILDLQAKGLLQPNRVNGLFMQYLAAALGPEELIHLAVADLDNPGFTVLRRGEFWTECTVAPDGSVAFDFPTTRSAVIATISSALSGAEGDAEGSRERFRFVGRVDDAFVLAAAVRHWRNNGQPVDPEVLAAAVQRDATIPGLTAGLELVGGTAPFDTLTSDRNAFDAALGRLLTGGQLVSASGGVRPSEQTVGALGDDAVGSFSLSRLTQVGGALKRRTLTAMRTPSTTLVFRQRHRDGQHLVEWREVTPRDLRALVLATCLDERASARLAEAAEERPG